MPSPQEPRVLKAQAKSKRRRGQALTDPSLPSPSSLSQAHSSCLLAGAVSASPVPHHKPKLRCPAQLLTITGAAARLDLLGCGLRASWFPGPRWVPQDLCSPFHSSMRHQMLTDGILKIQSTQKSSGEINSIVSLLFLNYIVSE